MRTILITEAAKEALVGLFGKKVLLNLSIDGRFISIPQYVWERLEARRAAGETISDTIVRLATGGRDARL